MFDPPSAVGAGRYLSPGRPGIGARMLPASIEQFTYPHGPAWNVPGRRWAGDGVPGRQWWCPEDAVVVLAEG